MPTLDTGILVVNPCFNQGELTSFDKFQNMLDYMKLRTSEKQTLLMTSSNKKNKRNLIESDSENETTEYPRYK